MDNTETEDMSKKIADFWEEEKKLYLQNTTAYEIEARRAHQLLSENNLKISANLFALAMAKMLQDLSDDDEKEGGRNFGK